MPSYVLFSVCSLIWGSTFWAITLQLNEVPPAVSIVYRFGLASAVLFLWCRLRGDRLLLPWRIQGWVALQGFLSFGLSYVCTYHSEKYLVSALVAVLFALMVLLTPICARVAFGVPVSPRIWGAGAGALVGVTLLFWHANGAALRDEQPGLVLGVVLALAATFATSAGAVVVGKVREQSSNVVLTTAWSMLWGTLMVAGFAFATGEHFILPHAPGYWLSLIYLSVFGSVIAFVAYFTLINRIGSQKTVFISVVTPVVALLLSVGLENFRPGLREVLGVLICLASVAYVLRAPTGNELRRAARAGEVVDTVR